MVSSLLLIWISLSRLYSKGKQKKTRRFAETKRLVNPKDTRLYV
jgi:hypothetical protein